MVKASDLIKAMIIFIGCLAVVWLPAIIAIAALWLVWQILKSIVKWNRRRGRVSRLKKANRLAIVDAEPVDDETEFANLL